jgi:hypothetical protein
MQSNRLNQMIHYSSDFLSQFDLSSIMKKSSAENFHLFAFYYFSLNFLVEWTTIQLIHVISILSSPFDLLTIFYSIPIDRIKINNVNLTDPQLVPVLSVLFSQAKFASSCNVN